MNENKDTFGERMRRYRKSTGMTMKELALKLDISEQAISQYENNKREPNIGMLKKIAKELDITLNSLLGINEKIKLEECDKGISFDVKSLDFNELKEFFNSLNDDVFDFETYMTLEENSAMKKNLSNLSNANKLMETRNKTIQAILEVININKNNEEIKEISTLFISLCKTISELDKLESDTLKNSRYIINNLSYRLKDIKNILNN
ncbi:helix-turn-helix domain-containing protein [Clostridium sp.]|uniref:helix-turn-helix domain-containing protein n=1 Tax=Clostridium sp. TaxID=1506 RepID=UPI00291080D2|nr:helix-turn-helix domain-containing protein [Clostridium sp.]MDU4142727.1 helix-turn-helix domain-containing protein [Clostridium sp.]